MPGTLWIMRHQAPANNHWPSSGCTYLGNYNQVGAMISAGLGWANELVGSHGITFGRSALILVAAAAVSF